ncbi:hypothetical protein BHM03_00058939 [Ensete ventricosum]|nr:hypothetical protein BHM03_00058939 [Ensete ventricosum]
MQKIDFKLRVIRLNRVESFYAFLLRFRSEGNEEEGQQGMARPPARGWLATAKAPLQMGSRLRPGPLQGATARRGTSHPWARPAAAKAPLQRGGRLRPGPLQEVTARGGSSPQGAATRRGSSRLRAQLATASPHGAAARAAPAMACRPRPCRKGRLPATRLQGGGQPCRLYRGSNSDGVEGGKERARASF